MDSISEPTVPIPSEPVTPVQVNQLAGLTQSAAIESLIQQNVDLTTRLNINLRRVAELERVLQNLSSHGQAFESQKEAFREEVQVLHKRFQVQESKLLNFRLEKENAEKAYATLVIEHRALKEKLEAERNQWQLTFARYERFKSKIHNYIRPLFRSLNADSILLNDVRDDLYRMKRYRSRIQKFVRPFVRNMKSELKSYKSNCERLEVKTTELSLRIEELLTHLRTKSEQFEADQQKLVGYHEQRYSEIKKELDLSQNDLQSFQARYNSEHTERCRLEEENVDLNNRVITAERRLEEVESRFRADIEKLQTDLKRFEEMWAESTKNSESISIQLEAAQNLNSSLNADLTAEREKNEELRARIRQMKIQEVAQQSMKRAAPLLELEPKVPQIIVEDRPISKIESLFAEIQSGDISANSEEELREDGLNTEA